MKGDQERETEETRPRIPRTNEKKCPKCESADVQYEGPAGSPASSADRLAEASLHHYTCRNCRKHFLCSEGP